MYLFFCLNSHVPWFDCEGTPHTVSWVGIAWWSQTFSKSTTGLNSVFLFLDWLPHYACLLCYLSIAGRRIVGFEPFARGLMQCEMQTALFRFLTRVAKFILFYKWIETK